MKGVRVGHPLQVPRDDPTVARAKKAGARYVVVDERYTAQMALGMAPLLNPRLAPADLSLIKQFAPYPRSRVAIYEVVQRSP